MLCLTYSPYMPFAMVALVKKFSLWWLFMVIRSDDRQALSCSLAEVAGMGRLEFNNALLTNCDSLLYRLRDRILNSDCRVYVLLHHICRRLESADGNFSSLNLRRLLTTENAMSSFLRNHEIVFKIIDESIVPFVNGKRIDLTHTLTPYEANIKFRLLGVNGVVDTCVNGYALGDSVQNNNEFSYYSECPELIFMLDQIFPSIGLFHDYQEQSSVYLISYPVNVVDVILDDLEQACCRDKVEELVRCYLKRLLDGFGRDEMINADLGNVILRVGDDVDLSGKGCIVRKLNKGRLELLQDIL